MNQHLSSKNFIFLIVTMLIGILCFVWFTYHTTAIRYSASLLALIILLAVNYHAERTLSLLKPLRPVIIALSLIILSLLIQTYLFALAPYEALDAIRNEWFKALLMGVLAVLLVRYTLISHISPSLTVTFIVLSLFLVVLVYYIDLMLGLMTGKISTLWGQIRYPFNSEFSEEGRESFSTMLVLLLCILAGELLYRMRSSKTYLQLSNTTLYIIIALSVVAVFLLKTRLSQINLFILIAIFFYLFYRAKYSPSSLTVPSRYIYLKIATLLIIILGLGYYAIKQDERWNTLMDASLYIMAESDSKLWLKDYFDQATPEQQAFVEQNHSNYLRLSLLREGLRTIIAHPQGVGYGKQAFKKAIQLTQHATPLLGSSHSGIIEFTLGAGVVGLVFVLCWFGALLWFARQYSAHPVALMLYLLTIIYLLQNLLDQRLMDHYLEFFIFSSFLLMSTIVADGLKQPRQNSSAG